MNQKIYSIDPSYLSKIIETNYSFFSKTFDSDLRIFKFDAAERSPKGAIALTCPAFPRRNQRIGSRASLLLLLLLLSHFGYDPANYRGGRRGDCVNVRRLMVCTSGRDKRGKKKKGREEKSGQKSREKKIDRGERGSEKERIWRGRGRGYATTPRNRAPKRLYGNYTREIGEIWSREMRCGHPSLSRPTCPRLPSKPAACLPALPALPACLPACLLAWLACLPCLAFLPACLPACLSPFLLSSQPQCTGGSSTFVDSSTDFAKENHHR